MESNVAGLRCERCWAVVEALYPGRFHNSGRLCQMCWAWESGDVPQARGVLPLVTVQGGLSQPRHR